MNDQYRNISQRMVRLLGSISILLFCAVLSSISVSAQTPTQFTGLKACTVTQQNPETTTGDCAAYASPADPQPPLYDGTAGTIYTDPVFGTKIKRITPQPGMAVDKYAPRDAPEQAWNSDGSYLKLKKYTGDTDQLFQGTDPYTFIRQLGIANDGNDELVAIWAHTDRCILIQPKNRQILKIDVCNGDTATVLTHDGGLTDYTTLTDTLGNVLNLTTPATLFLKPKAYCGISRDDTKIGMVVQSGSATYGFGVWSLNLAANTSSLVWFHNITATGDWTETGSPSNKMPGASCISDDGNYVFTTWTIGGAGVSSIVRDGSGNVTLTTSSNLNPLITTGSTVTVESPIAGWAGQFVVTVTGAKTITYSQAGAAGSPSSYVGITLQFGKYYGTEVYGAAAPGALIAQLGQAGTHMDNIQMTDGQGATYDRSFAYSTMQGRTRQAMRYASMSGAPFPNCWSASVNIPCGITGFGSIWMPAAYTSATKQWHVSGQGSLGTSGLKGYGLESSYYDGNGVDCATQVVLCAEVFAEDMSGPPGTIYRIAHTQANKGTSYFGEPHATPNNNFTKVIFASSWRQPANLNPVDAYLVELGAAPNADTGTFTAPAGPYPATVSGATVTLTCAVTPGQGTATTHFWYTNATHPIGTAQTGNTPSVTLDSTTLPNATYTIGADITDTGGGSGNCSPITITVNNAVNATVPTISVPNSQITGNVTATGTCTPGQGTANTWQALLGGANFGAAQAGAGPYSVTATSNTLGCLDGLCTFTATCGDTGGGTGTSAPQVRTVKNGITPTGVMR